MPDASWKGATSGYSAAPGSQRRFRMTLLVGLLLGLVTFVIVWLLLLHAVPPEPYFVTINIGDHNDPLYPLVPFAKQDSQRLARHFEHKPDEETKTKKLLVDKLAELANFTGRPLVVHLSALAQVRDNKVYILPVEADPSSTSSWLLLENVVDAVGRCRENKLLILDLAHPMADPRLGVLDDRIAQHVDDYLKKNPPNYFILCSCAGGQTSLTSEYLQAGVLAYYLDKGLEGAADGVGPGAQVDKVITAKELIAYVQPRINHWAGINRQQRQQPTLHGQANDFPLANLLTRIPPKYEITPRSYPSTLKEGWEARDSWKPLGLGPRGLTELEAVLLRQDRRWQGGANVDDFAGAVRKTKSAVERLQGPPLTPLFLDNAVPASKKDERLVRIMSSFFDDAAAKTADPAKVLDAFKKKLAEMKDADPGQITWALTKALSLPTELHESQVRMALAVSPDAAGKPGEGGPVFVETIYLQRLVDYAERIKESYTWPKEKVQHLFRTMRARQAVLAALAQDPALLHWVRPQFKDADEARQTAEKKLLFGLPLSWKVADEQFVDAAVKFDDASRLLEKLHTCRQALNEALVSLPGLAPLLVDWPEVDADALAGWHRAADFAESLKPWFGAESARPDPKTLPGKLPQLEKQAHELKGQLDKLQAMLHERVERTQRDSGPAALDQALCLRASAALSVRDRLALEARSAELAKTLQDKTDDDESKNAPTPAVPTPRYPWEAVKHANARTQLAVALFELRGVESLADITKVEQIDPLETRLQKALAEREAKSSAKREDSALAARPPWKGFTVWLQTVYRDERDFWSADGTKESPAITAFYGNLALRLSQME